MEQRCAYHIVPIFIIIKNKIETCKVQQLLGIDERSIIKPKKFLY